MADPITGNNELCIACIAR